MEATDVRTIHGFLAVTVLPRAVIVISTGWFGWAFKTLDRTTSVWLYCFCGEGTKVMGHAGIWTWAE